MAAIVRIARFTGGATALRRISCPFLPKHFNSQFGVRQTTSGSLYVRSRADLLERRFSASAASPVVDASEKQKLASQALQPSGSPLESHLKQLDDQVRRWGRIDAEQVEKLLKLASGAGKLSTQQSIMILRCTGSLLKKESSAERNVLFEKAWNLLKSHEAELNIQVYNAMLRTKLENKQSFSPVDVLSEIEKDKHLVPNRVTYQLLLSQFCEKGDIAEASTILEHMKSQNLPVNENIFNALVKGHIKKGDLAGAKAVLSSMSESGMDPTADSYQTLMCGLAEKGDLAGIDQFLEEAEKASVKFSPHHLYDLIVSLVEAGHNESIDKFLNYIQRKMPKYNQDALNCIFQLVAEGHDDMALRVFLSMDHSSYEGQRERSLGTVLLRAMIIKGRPIEKVMEIRSKLIAENMLSDSLEEIANLALRYQHSGYALEVFEKMKKEGSDVKQHYFWPVLKAATERMDVKGVLEAVASLVKCTDGKNEIVAGTVFLWAVKPLVLKGVALETLISGIKDAGVNESEVEMIHSAQLMSTGKLEEAATLINAGTKFSPAILKVEVVNGFFESKLNSAELIKVIQAANHQLSNSFTDGNSGILLGILKKKALSTEVATNLIEEWVKANLKLLKNFEKPIKEELEYLAVAPSTLKKLDDLFTDTSEERIPLEEIKKASVAEVESWLEKVKGQRSGRTNSLERLLLAKYCHAGMLDKVDELKKTLDKRGFVYDRDLLRQLGTLAARDKGNLEEALAFKQQLETQYPEFGAYAALVLHIAKLQLSVKKFEDALNAMQSFSSRHLASLQKPGFSDGYFLSDLCREVLKTCSEVYEEPSKTHQLCDAMFENGFVKLGTTSLLNEVMNAYIKKGDLDDITTALETFVTKTNKAPQFSDVFQLLVKKEDAQRLQRVVDLVTTVHGEINTLLHLVASFIECNRIRQARKILETPGFRASMKPLIDGCERFLKLDKEKELEQLVEITKNLPQIDRDEMLLQLMRFYAKTKNTKKLMEVFSLYDEERVRPRPRTLRYVAKVLESNNEPVPFEVPSAENILQESFRPPSSEIETEAQAALEAKDVAKVMAIKEKKDAEGIENGIDFAVNVARFLFIRKNNQMFRKFAHQLAVSGDTDSLLAIRKLGPSKTLENFVHQRLFLAYLHKNKAEEILDYLKENPLQLPRYLTTNALNLLNEKAPELMPTLISAIESHLEKSEMIQPAGLLYNFYILNGKTKEVEDMFQKFPNVKERVRLSYVCQMARRLQREDILQKVIELHQSDNIRRLIVPYNQLLLLKCDQGDWVPVLECYQSALDFGLTFDDFWVRSLQTVASLLEGNGQPLPWQPGMLERRAASESKSHRKNLSASSSSDDDSSSESDVEETPTKSTKT